MFRASAPRHAVRSCGIVGHPRVGKTTVFNLLTQGNSPEPGVGFSDVPDRRLDALHGLVGRGKRVCTRMRWVDVPAYSPRAPNLCTAKARTCHVLLHVLNCFEADAPEPAAAITEVHTEFQLADLQSIEKKLKLIGGRREPELCGTLQKFQRWLEDGKPLRDLMLSPAEVLMAEPYQFLSAKPVVYLCNVDETGLRDSPRAAAAPAAAPAARVLTMCAALEELLTVCNEKEAQQVRSEYQLETSAVPAVAEAAFSVLGYHTFFTVGDVETRAWLIQPGSNAQQAAAQIHSEIATGLAKALVAPFDTFLAAGSLPAAERLYKAYGRDYVVQDGDVMHFKHR
eukprot:EG_transcript_13485